MTGSCGGRSQRSIIAVLGTRLTLSGVRRASIGGECIGAVAALAVGGGRAPSMQSNHSDIGQRGPSVSRTRPVVPDEQVFGSLQCS